MGGGDNNVPVFFDGIYISNTSAIDFGLVDLARVEVIKGPVSATYGRSAYAGAINYVTAKPTDTVTGQLQATGGDHGKYAFNGRISGPIVEGILKGGISASFDHFNGTYHDQRRPIRADNGYRKRDILANLDFTPERAHRDPTGRLLRQRQVFDGVGVGVRPRELRRQSRQGQLHRDLLRAVSRVARRCSAPMRLGRRSIWRRRAIQP